jgi:PcfJ-like protein
MGRRPKIWNIRMRKHGGLMIDPERTTKEIAKFDTEKLELLPFKQSFRCNRGYCAGVRTPIDSFLMNQIGRDYDEVYSELIQNIPKRLRERVALKEYKMPSSFHPSVSQWFLKDCAWYRNEAADGFYVDLATNTLGFVEKIGKHTLNEEVKTKPAYKPFELEKFKIRCDYGQNFVFQQLLTYDDFVKEATKMKHCIRTYWLLCVDMDYKKSIWSLTVGLEKKLTLEVSGKMIVQVRGIHNRRADEFEKMVIQKWAVWLKLTISDYAF